MLLLGAALFNNLASVMCVRLFYCRSSSFSPVMIVYILLPHRSYCDYTLSSALFFQPFGFLSQIEILSHVLDFSLIHYLSNPIRLCTYTQGIGSPLKVILLSLRFMYGALHSIYWLFSYNLFFQELIVSKIFAYEICLSLLRMCRKKNSYVVDRD